MHSNLIDVNAFKSCICKQFLPLFIFLSFFVGHSLSFENGAEVSSLGEFRKSGQSVHSQYASYIHGLSLQDKQHIVYTETEIQSEQEFEEKVFLPLQNLLQLVNTKLSYYCNSHYLKARDVEPKFHGIPLYAMYCSRRHHLL